MAIKDDGCDECCDCSNTNDNDNGNANSQCCDEESCCQDDGCKECCANQDKHIVIPSKMMFIFRIFGSLLFLISLIDLGLSAAIGSLGFSIFWAEFVFTMFSCVAAVFAIFPINRNFVIVLFTFSLVSSITTFIGLILVGAYVELCREVLYSDDDYFDNNNNSVELSCKQIFADFSLVFLRFCICVPLCVLSGLKLFGKRTLASEDEAPRSSIAINK